MKTLEGIKVVELANFIAAPAAGRYLSDYGADVLWIEAEKGDPMRHTGPQEGRPKSIIENTSIEYLHGGQKNLSLNVKTPEGMEILMKLLSEADVFITNWRLKALERAGLDYPTLKEKFPKLIYGMILGYGLTGPDKDLPGYDFTAFFSRGGYMNNLSKRGESPITLLAGLGDNNAGLMLALGLMTALYKRRDTGKGDFVSASLYETAIFNQSVWVLGAQYDGQARQYPIRFTDNRNPINIAYRTKDDRVIQVSLPDYDIRLEHFLDTIGRRDLFESGRFYPQTKMVADNTYPELIEAVQEWFVKHTKDEIVDCFVKADIPHALAYTWQEILEDPQAKAIGAFYEVETLNGKKLKVTHTPVRLASEPELPEERASYIGENSVEVLSDMGYSREEIRTLMEKGAVYEWDPLQELGKAENK